MRLNSIIFVADYIHPQYGYQEFHLAEALVRLCPKTKVHLYSSDRYFPFANYEEHFKLLGRRIHSKKSDIYDSLYINYFKPLLEFRTRVFFPLTLIYHVLKFSPSVLYIHSSTSPTSLVFILLSRFLPFRLALDSHMHYVAHNNTLVSQTFYSLFSLINKFIASPSVLYFGTTSESCDFLIKLEGARKKQVYLLEIGYPSRFFKFPQDFESYRLNRKKLRHKYNIKDTSLVVLQPGKITKDKKPNLLMNGLATLPSDIDVTVIFVGAHGEADKRSLLDSLGSLTPNISIRFYKSVPVAELSQFYLLSDISCFPGGASLSCIESASMGCKSIVAFTPEGIERSKKNLVYVPKSCSDNDFITKFRETCLLVRNIIMNTSVESNFLDKLALSESVKSYGYDSIALKLRDLIFSK